MSDIGKRIGFIGAGRMATALAKGVCASGFAQPADIVASDPLDVAREHFTAATGARTVESNVEVVSGSDVVVLAVKPQSMNDVLDEICEVAGDEHLIVSIAAGVSMQWIAFRWQTTRRVIRVMPNTPALIGAGASAFARGGKATDEDAAFVQRMLSTVGLVVEVNEELLDAVTGLSGSGPAFVYQVIEALSDGGVRMGLPREIAAELAAQTVLGAARMVLETGEHPAALKDAVASPGGTTIAGLHALEEAGLRSALMNAVQAATQRSRELGE